MFEPVRGAARRPTSAEMCDPLPTVLYKILPTNYATALMERGELMWSSLTFFQNELDPTRGDANEGSHRYFPAKGLEITRHFRKGRPDHERFTLSGHGSQIKALKCHHIFIYSTTLNPNLAVGEATDRSCVEIFDSEQFVRRIARAIDNHHRARLDRFIHGEVRYWSPEDPPKDVVAFPHLLTLHKHRSHEPEREYRFAFGLRADVFDFQNVFGFVVPPGYEFPKVTLNVGSHRMKLHLGALGDCCRIR